MPGPPRARRPAPPWSKPPGSRVRLPVYAGTVPSESSAIARMAVDGLQAATLTAGGLAEVGESVSRVGIPFFFQADAEVAYVQDKVAPMMVQRLQGKKFYLINWGNAGW